MKTSRKTHLGALPTHKTNRQGKRCTLAALSAIAVLSAPTLVTAGDDDTSKDKNPVELSTGIWEKPDWLTELSLAVHESNDSNVYLQNVGPLQNKPSFVTTVSPKIGIDLAPLFGKPDLLQVASFIYAPDFLIFENAPTQSYNAQRFATGLKGKDGDFSYSLDNAFTYIDGNDFAPLFPKSYNAYGTGTVRERLDQLQDRAKISLREDVGDFFIRPTASFLGYDLQTKHVNPSALDGYQNYVDRFDVNGGVDLGYKVDPNDAFTLGYRYGEQNQQGLPFASYETKKGVEIQSSNDYQRVLLGYEGKPAKWLTLAIQAGPDFRSYNAATPIPTEDLNEVKAFAEGSATAELTSLDTLALKYNRWSWVSSTGKVPYVDSLYDLSYRRKLTDKLTFQAGARAANSNYDTNTLGTAGAPSPRNDWEYTLSAGLKYDFTANLSADVSYSQDWGRSDDDVSDATANDRSFERSVVSIGTKWAF
jgi:hypothetical protein